MVPDRPDEPRHAPYMQIIERIAEPGKLAIAFRHTARHTGPWTTPLGVLEPTGSMVAGLGIDLLTVRDGRITEVWVLADELQRLVQVRAPTSKPG
jgi:SnoaL-like polyketide cyclase